MATIKEIKELALHAARGTAPENFSNENVNDALRDELRAMCSSINEFKRNQYDIFDIIIETVDNVVPQKVIDRIGMFAEVKTVGHGQKAMFKRKVGKNRAKQFLTQVGLSGVYETFRLDAETFELKPYVYAGAGIVDFERYLDGTEDIMDIYDILIEGLMDRIFEDIEACLISSWNDSGRPAANKVAVTAFDPDKMADMIQTVSAYGAPVIYCGPQFAAKMANGITYGSTVKMSDSDIEEFRNTGYIGKFAGAPVVVIPNSFVDEENTKLVFNPRFAYVLPAGKEKLVKVGLIGDTHFKEVESRDWSMEVQMYKKIGVGMVAEPNFWGIYYNAGIPDGGWDNSSLNIVP